MAEELDDQDKWADAYNRGVRRERRRVIQFLEQQAAIERGLSKDGRCSLTLLACATAIQQGRLEKE